MSHWNANGLVERELIGRRRKIMDAVVAEKKEEIKLSDSSKERLERLVNTIEGGYGRVDTIYKKHIIEEYLTILLEPVFKKNPFFAEYKAFKVILMDDHQANYFSSKIELCLYKTQDGMDRGGHNAWIHVELRELFRNCSSICISRLESDSFSTRYISSDIVENYKKGLKEFINYYLGILVGLCKKLNYSCILYTESSETNHYVASYLEKDWKCVNEFINKRNSNKIRYFVKNL